MTHFFRVFIGVWPLLLIGNLWRMGYKGLAVITLVWAVTSLWSFYKSRRELSKRLAESGAAARRRASGPNLHVVTAEKEKKQR